MEDWIYIGWFLKQDQKEKLLKALQPTIPAGWKLYVDHMTYVFNDGSETAKIAYEGIKDRFGEVNKLHIDAVGNNGKAIALHVVEKNFTLNKVPHITLATAPGVPPVESNNITEWTPVPGKPYEVEVELRSFNKTKKV